MNLLNRVKGSISIFLILILVPMYTGAYYVIDFVRIFAAKDMLSGTLNLAENSLLSKFNGVLYDKYGLFVMSKNEDQQIKDLMELTQQNLNSGNRWNRGFLSQNLDSVSFKYDNNSALTNVDVLESLILECQKYNAPYKLTKDLILKIDFLSNVYTVSGVLEKASEYIDDATNIEAMLKEVWNTFPSEVNDNNTKIQKLNELLLKLEEVEKTINSVELKYSELTELANKISNPELRSVMLESFVTSGKALTHEAVKELKMKVKNDINSLIETGKNEVVSYTKSVLYEYMKSAFKDFENVNALNTQLSQISKFELTTLYDEIEDISIPNLVNENIYNKIVENNNITVNETPESLSNINNEGANASISYVMHEFSLNNLKMDMVKDNIYISNFIVSQFNNFLVNKDESFVGEVEYLIFGNENQISNIRRTINLIFAIRFVFNSIYAFSNKEMIDQATIASTAITSVTGIGSVLAKNMVLMTWCLAEAYEDIKNICEGNYIPLLKSEITWITKIENIPDLLSGKEIELEKESDNNLLSMSYKDYLFIFALLKLESEKGRLAILRRCGIVMQIECQNDDSQFDISRCYTMATINIKSRINGHKINEEKNIQYFK